jgi:nuclear pore complex protein Nup155
LVSASHDQQGGSATTSHLAKEAEDQRINAYQQAQSSTDALFHVAMYDWLLSRNKTDELLRIRSPYVEDYLRSEPITLERCLLLCLWYVSVGESFSAAQLYAGLAKSKELDLTLEDRMEYLTKASGNAQSTFQHSQEIVNFINDIGEELEVSSIQIEVYQSVQESIEIEEEEKVKLLAVLNENLLNITELYRDFAEPLQMHEVKLLIYHISDHREPELVRQAWEALIAEGECRRRGGSAARWDLSTQASVFSVPTFYSPRGLDSDARDSLRKGSFCCCGTGSTLLSF